MNVLPKIKRKKVKESKKSIENKLLIKTLNEKIFKGFQKIEFLKRYKSRRLPKNKKKASPLTEWEEEKPYFFEDKFRFTYKENFLHSLNGPELQALEVINFKDLPVRDMDTEPRRYNVFLTCKNKNSKINLNNKEDEELIDNVNQSSDNAEKEYDNNVVQNLTQPPIVYDTNTSAQINNLKFFAIEQEDTSPSKKKNPKNKKDPYEDIDFLRKISIEPKENKILKFKGLTTGFQAHKIKEDSPKETNPNFCLDIEYKSAANFYPKKMTPEEKKLRLLERNLNQLANIQNGFLANFEENLMKQPPKTPITDTKQEKQPNIVDLNQYTLSNVKDMLHQRQMSQAYQKDPNLVPKRPSNFSIGEYRNKILKNHRDKFQNLKEMAFGRPNTVETDENYIKFCPKINNNSHLLSQKKFTHKIVYDKQSKIRDVKIAVTFRKIFTEKDTHRILNGKVPLDFEYESEMNKNKNQN